MDSETWVKNGAGDGRFRESVLLSFVSFTFAADCLTVIFAGDALSLCEYPVCVYVCARVKLFSCGRSLQHYGL